MMDIKTCEECWKHVLKQKPNNNANIVIMLIMLILDLKKKQSWKVPHVHLAFCDTFSVPAVMNGSQVSDRLMCSWRQHRKHDIPAAHRHAETVDVNICHLMAEMHTGQVFRAKVRLWCIINTSKTPHRLCKCGIKGIFQRTNVGEYSWRHFSANL